MGEREDGVYKKQTNIKRATNPACGAGSYGVGFKLVAGGGTAAVTA